jgi:adenine deaminase
MKEFIKSLPKAELHLHIEGSFEPELMFAIAQRNNVRTSFQTIDELKAAYNFHNLQSFLDIYYQGCCGFVKRRRFL